MLKRLLVAPWLFLALLMVLGLSLSAGDQALADSTCVETTIVRRGDTLAAIAASNGTTEAELLRLNPQINNPRHIYAGQVLCVPGAADMLTDQSEPLDSMIVIEASYSVSPTEEDAAWNLQSRNGQVGRRVEYALPTIGSIRFTTTTVDMNAALEQMPGSGLIVRRNESDEKYTLTFVGDEPPLLSSILITPSVPISLGLPCQSVPISQVLDSEYARAASVTLWLESADGLRFPLEVTELDYVPTVARAASCYRPHLMPEKNRTVLVLSPLDDTGHSFQTTVFMWNGIFGPDGNGTRIRCASWAGQRNIIYRVLGAFRGC